MKMGWLGSSMAMLVLVGCGGELSGATGSTDSDYVANDIVCEHVETSPTATAALKGTFLRGDLGCFPADDPALGAALFVETLALDNFDATGSETLKAQNVFHDELGQVHVRLTQQINGVPVVGAQVVVHADAETGRVHLLNGEMVTEHEVDSYPTLEADAALKKVQAGFVNPQPLDDPTLVYVMTPDLTAELAWQQTLQYDNDGELAIDRIYASALDGTLVARHPLIHSAKNRNIYTAFNGTSLPGSLVISEGGSSGDFDAQSAYNYIGNTYDYYNARFGRDSFNNGGATMTMTVHYSSGYNNAFWNGSQMVFGDGDGSLFGPFARSLDVVAHEFTHAVTQYSAGLIYMNESGALNEAMSDIFAASVESYANGGTINSDTWKVGEDCYTPGTAGDALRYMDRPTDDGYSYDYYPERYTGSADNGGVHLNSGIANLAFNLMVEGGRHPRAKTNIDVTPIGMAKAEQVFYRALTLYMTNNSQFNDAKSATVQAATDLYGATDAQRVADAWNAVGVNSVVASFNADNTFGYAPLEVRFTSTSQGATSHYWSFGDGYNSNNPNPVHTYDNAGTYTAQLTVDGGATVGQQIQAVVKPGVDFEVDDTTVEEGDEVEFRNVSYGLIYGYEWNFGDGTTSSLENPTHRYEKNGSYTVTLTVFGEAGPVATVKSDLIDVDEPSMGLFPGLGCSVTPAQGTGGSAAVLALLGFGVALVWRRKRME